MQKATLTKNSQDQSVLAKNNLSTISEIRKGIKAKVKEDLFRFRTCCADPRASK